ncbi:hypothetical protein R1flu_020188 [Riccia fluitans]|uniref:BHLH domain-containing protein n=1 Tax=Riccia fluitans TaxID=41844 RepID=A0ABD1ZL73_9MARC
MAELAWLTSSPAAAKVTVNGSSTFNSCNSNENLFDLLQGRIGSSTGGGAFGVGGTPAAAATDSSPFFRTSDQMGVTDHTESSISILKAEDGNDHLQPSLWVAAADGIYSCSSAAAAHVSNIDCNTNQLSTYVKPHDPSPQLQALRDFMAFGTSNSNYHHHHGHHSMPTNVPLENVNLLTSAAAAAPMFLHLGDDSPASHPQLQQQLIGIPHHQSSSLVVDSSQTKSPDLMAYRVLCQAELFATEKSPHRTQFQRENHILAERQRREEMNEKFSALRSMIPKATKKDKASIVGDTIAYVLELEKTLKHLKACKDSRKGYSHKLVGRKRSSSSLKVMDDCDRSNSETPPDPAALTTNTGTAVEETKPGPSCTTGFEDTTEVKERSKESQPEPTANSSSEKFGCESDSSSKHKEKVKEKRVGVDTTVEVQHLGDQQAVIKIVCARSQGLVLRILQALDDCKMEVLQSNVTSNSQQCVHFITVQLKATERDNICDSTSGHFKYVSHAGHNLLLTQE